MEFLVVSDSKLKIMLTAKDMRKYGIDGEDLNYDDPKIRRSFWRILDEAKAECGFDVAGDKVLIQFYPSKDGSEIFVTKLGIIPQGAERAISRSGKVAMLSTRRAVYKFSDVEAMLGAVRIVSTEEGESEPQLFSDDRGSYYIIINERRALSEHGAEYSPISEYGSEIPSNVGSYISEHATRLDYGVIKQL